MSDIKTIAVNGVRADKATLGDWRDFVPMYGKGHHGKKTAMLVERDDRITKIGAIFIPEQAQEVPHRGIIRRVGKDVRECSVGDVIRFSARGRPEVFIQGRLFNIIVEEDVYLIGED